MSKKRISRVAVGVVALLLAAVLAGCDDEDPPEPQGPIESSSEPTSSATTPPAEPTPTDPVAPTLPTEAEPETNAGAKAFVSYYWEVVNYAQHTGDVDPLKSISEDNCEGCNGGISYITRVYRRGGHIVGGDFELASAAPGRTPSGAWHVSAKVHVERSTTTSTATSIRSREQANSSSCLVSRTSATGGN